MRPCLAPMSLALAVTCAAAPAVAAPQPNLLSLGAGVVVVVEPATYASWPVLAILDDDAASGWACAEGRTTGNVFVFELPEPSTFSAFEFDTAGIDQDGAGARDVVVEVSASSATSGFAPVLRASLKDRADGQRLSAAAPVEGRFVRLTILNNHGNDTWTELMGFRGYGTQRQPKPLGDISGTYDTSYSKFHLRQQGTALVGCYEYDEGVFEGTIEGRVMKLAWTEGDGHGPAVFVFTPDGQSFLGHWWHGTDKGLPAGAWNGKRVSTQVGGCPHWSGSVAGELHKDLAGSGRARLYGILFDVDKATIRSESLPTLDEVVRLLATEPDWRLLIEGHTDSTGSPAHNRTLSEARAAAVKAYLVSRGVEEARLTTAGLGAERPVADNATELGRAQNRRVEFARR